MADTSWTGHVVEKGKAITFTNEEYDLIVTNDYVPRITFGDDFLGFYMVVDTALELIEDDLEELEKDEEEYALLKSVQEKLIPFKGSAIFLP